MKDLEAPLSMVSGAPLHHLLSLMWSCPQPSQAEPLLFFSIIFLCFLFIVVVPSTKSSRTTSIFFFYFLFIVVVPSTNSSRPTSIFFFYFFVIYLSWSCPQPSQAEPLLFFL